MFTVVRTYIVTVNNKAKLFLAAVHNKAMGYKKICKATIALTVTIRMDADSII